MEILAGATLCPQLGNPYSDNLKASPSLYHTEHLDQVSLFVFSWNIRAYFPPLPLDPQPRRILKGSTLLRWCKHTQQKDAPEMTLKQDQINLSNVSCCRDKAFLEPWSGLWKAGYGEGWHPLSSSPWQPEKGWFKGAKQNTHLHDRIVNLIPQSLILLACKTRSDNCNQFSTFTVVEIITSVPLPRFPETPFSADYFKLI